MVILKNFACLNHVYLLFDVTVELKKMDIDYTDGTLVNTHRKSQKLRRGLQKWK